MVGERLPAAAVGEMELMRGLWQGVLSLALGFAGGVLATRVVPPRSLNGQAQVVKATRFELADSSGRTVSIWGQNKGTGEIILEFDDPNQQPRAEFGIKPSQLHDSNATAYTPFMVLIGPDSKPRIQQILDPDARPVLAMGDSKSENRLLLGRFNRGDSSPDMKDKWDNWSLVFRDPSQGWRDYAEIGVTTPLNTQKRTGYVTLRNTLDHQVSMEPK